MMDKMLGATRKYKDHLRKSGKLDHFSNPVVEQPAAPAPEPVTHEAFCMKCKTKRTVETQEVVPHATNASGAPHRAVGDCPVCGTKTHAFKSDQDGKKLHDALEANRAQVGA